MLTLSIDHRILNEATHVDVLSCCFSHKVSVIHLCSVETFVYLFLAGSTNTVSCRKLKKKNLLYY